jgi:hypothetical protein
MWYIIIIVVLVLIIYKFMSDYKKQEAEIALEGGMEKKYSVLIKILLSSDDRCKIYQVTKSSVTLGLSLKNVGTTIFILQQSFSKISIQWSVDVPGFGKHKLEWTFPEFDDQELIASIIFEEISNYQKKLRF